MRYVAAIIAVLLLLAGSAMFFYWDETVGIFLPLLLVFSRRVIWRIISRLVWLFLIIRLMPEKWRHRYFDLMNELASDVKQARQEYGGDIAKIWKFAPWWLRILMTILCAILSGLTALALLILPIHVSKIPFIGFWLRETAIPYLMRTAATRGIEMHIPPAWQKVPGSFRDRIDKWYLGIWWRTARPLVHTRQALGKHALRHGKRPHQQK